MAGQLSDQSAQPVRDVAIVHDWMPVFGGAEKVVQEMVRSFPGSTLYTLFDFLSEDERSEITQGRPIHVSRLNRLPGVQHYYRYLFLVCTRIIEGFDLSRHETVLSSSAALAKGVLTAPGQQHFAYVHAPARYAWDLTHDYINGVSGLLAGLKRHVARKMLHKYRIWDLRTAPSVDHFIANSNFTRKRIWKVYRRDAEVIYPPVNTDRFEIGTAPRGEHYLTVSRMVPYKKIPLIAAAFAARPQLRLRIVGTGPEMRAVRAAAGPNVEILGHLPFEQMKAEVQTARALVFAAVEDFGIVPLEAQACGTPVIALGRGGTAETVRPLGQDAPTGIWFEEQTLESLVGAIDRFEAEGSAFDPSVCRANAKVFSAKRFRREISDFVAERSRA